MTTAAKGRDNAWTGTPFFFLFFYLHDWERAHQLAAAGEGYAWPDITCEERKTPTIALQRQLEARLSYDPKEAPGSSLVGS